MYTFCVTKLKYLGDQKAPLFVFKPFLFTLEAQPLIILRLFSPAVRATG